MTATRLPVQLLVLSDGQVALTLGDANPQVFQSWKHYLAAGITAYADIDLVTVRPARLVIVCSYCNTILGTKPCDLAMAGRHTDSICLDCLGELNQQLDAAEAAKGTP